MLEFAIAMFIAISCSVAGDFFVKKGASSTRGIELRGVGGPHGLIDLAQLRQKIDASGILRSKKLLLGIGFLTVHFSGFVVAMRLAPVTLVVPLMACTYVATTILGRFLLYEQVTPLRWSGVAVIVAGVVILGLSSESGAGPSVRAGPHAQSPPMAIDSRSPRR